MGKIRTRIIGLEEVEEKQKKAQKQRAQDKKVGEKIAKTEAAEESKKETITAPEEKKKTKRQAKTRIRGKNYKNAFRLRSEQAKKGFTIKEAVQLLKKIKYAGFDEAVELHINVLETGLKGECALPHSTGKTVRVKITDDEVLKQIESGKIDFDVLISAPSYMPRLAKYAKILGPRGLMPNPKNGTISDKPEEVAKKFQSGALRWKTEPKFPLVHLMIGKVSASDKDLVENAETLVKSIGKNNIKAVFIKSTMSPSIKLQVV